MNKKIYQKYFPLKRFGQNFLINKIIINNIIQLINPKKNEIFIEIGPGLAALTEPICNILNTLIVIEIDSNLLTFLRKKKFFSKLIVFNEDAVTFDYVKLFYKKKKLIRIIGNLPYNISISLIIHLLKNIYIIKDMNFMIQKEVAERLVAEPGSKKYGRLSILVQYYCKIKILLTILPTSFFPIPKVHSVFVHLIPHKKYPIYVYDIDILSHITNVAFQKRRKILRHSLSSLFSIKRLLKLGIDPMLRAENVSVLEYCKMANYLWYKKFYT